MGTSADDLAVGQGLLELGDASRSDSNCSSASPAFTLLPSRRDEFHLAVVRVNRQRPLLHSR